MKTKALLLADTEGSVRLWEADRAETAAAFRKLDELVAEAAAKHQAERPLEQGEGDSFVLAFEDAAKAATAAIDLQRAITNDTALRVRMAIHVGEVETKPDGRYAGHAFNRVARLRALAHGGQVLLTRPAADQAAAKLPTDATLTDLGEHRLRDLAKPERVSQLCHPELKTDFPPILSLSALPNNLPVQTTTFVGRQDEIEQLTELIALERLVTLTGAGGCGKTRLAIQVAAESSDGFRDGIWWVDLAPITDPALVPRTVARVLGVRDDTAEDQTDAIHRATKDKSLLIVLDNCEHLIESSARLGERLMTTATILATSREPLGLAGEHAYRVPSLPADQAISLFADRATKTRPNFKLNEETESQAKEICDRLDGIPLAIELAAARTRMMSPAQIVKALEDRFRVLTGGVRTALPRQRTLEASVDWSYQLLTDAEKQLLNRLSVFPGTFDLEAAEQTCAEEPDRYGVLNLLSGLVDRSLVQVESEAEHDRYRLLETIRVYARQKLTDAGQISATRTRHLDHYVALAEEAEPHLEGPATREWVSRLEADLDNIRAAMAWAVADGKPAKVLRLAGSIWAFWWLRGAAGEVDRLLDEALQAESIEPATRLKGLLAAEAVNFYTGDMETARRFGQEAVAIAETSGDLARAARALAWYAWSVTWLDPGRGRPIFEKGLALAKELSSPMFEFLFTYGLGFLCVLTGSMQEGLTFIRRAIEIEERQPGPMRTGHADAWLGIAYWLAGRLDEAEAFCRRGLEINHARGDLMFEQNALLGLTMTAIARADVREGRDLLAQLHDLTGRSGFRLGERNIAFAGWFEALDGNIEGALMALDNGIEDYRGFGYTWPLGTALCLSANLRLVNGSAARARELLTEARDLGVSHRMPWVEATALVGLARVELAAGSSEKAEELAHAALAVAVAASAMLIVVDALELIACACSPSRETFAARLHGAVAAMRSSIGSRPLPCNVPAYEDALTACRSSLGDEAFQAAWDEGAAMTADETIAFAQRGRGQRGRPTAGWDSLTPAELSVIQLVAQGLTNPEIATRLLCSRNTVKAHLAHVFAKLTLSTRAELAAEATRRGI